jgi:hypothetical protein
VVSRQPIKKGVKKPRTHLALVIAMLGLAAALIAPGSAAARSCPAQGHPIYSMSVYNGAGCGAGAVIAHQLAQRFDAPSDFRGGLSRNFIYQHDARGRRWKCQWNSASVRNDSVNWNCARRPGSLISWMWHAHGL